MIKEYDGKKPIEEIIKNSKRTVIDFFATWCGPCKMLGNVLKNTDSDDVEVVKVDIDKFKNIAIEFGVRGVPTMFLAVDGNIKDTNVGFLNEEQFLAWSRK